MAAPYDHLKLVQENINFTRQGRPDRRPDNRVHPPSHGQMLQSGFNRKSEEHNEQKKIGEDFIFRIIKESEKPINYKKLGLTLLAEISGNQAVVRVDNATIFNSHLTEFTANTIAKSRALHYSEFANMGEFVFQTPEEKMGPLLKSEEVIDDGIYVIDVQLYIGDDSLQQIHQKASGFKEFLRSNEIRIIDDCILSNLAILKIQLRGKQVIGVLEHKNVYFADLPQQSQSNYEGARELGPAQLPDVIPPDADSPFVCIVDSGILPSHPLLKGTVYDSEHFGDLPNAFDENGHGTMAAGIVLYGDVYSALTNHQELSPKVKLLNARVTNKENLFPDDRVLASVIREAIEYFASDEYECKIFNLSLGDPRSPYIQGTKMDPWSYVLDDLNNKYNIAIIASAGNYSPNAKETVLDQYVDYLLDDPEAAIIPPALAVSSITVGSKAKTDVPYGADSSLRHVKIAAIENISPFSRSGFGYKKSIKPETIAYGGNLSLDTISKRINDRDRNLGILSTSLFNNGSWFEVRSGTSFAAPYITHLLSKIKAIIPEAKGNLLRALLLNKSTNKTVANETIVNKYEPLALKPAEMKSKLLRLSGYGEIREQFLLNSFDNFVTLYQEGEIGIDKVNVFEIPIPDIVYDSAGKTTINITLAYNPPVRDSRIDYVGTKMSFELYRGLTLHEIRNYTCKPDEDEFEKDRLPENKKSCKCDLSPSMDQVKRGTLLHSTHVISKSRKSRTKYGDTYYLVVKCAKRWYEGTSNQQYAVAVSFENEDESVQLYAGLQNRVEQRSRQQTRVRT